MTYSYQDVPLSSAAVVQIDYSGNHDFATTTDFSCQLGTATIGTAEVQTFHNSDRCGNRRTGSTKRSSGEDTLDLGLIYTDAVGAADDEYDEALNNKGNAIAVRVFPAGTATNARYHQIIGTLKNVSPANVDGNDDDKTFGIMVGGVYSSDKVSA